MNGDDIWACHCEIKCWIRQRLRRNICCSHLQDNQMEVVEGKLFGGTSSSVSEALYLSNNHLTCLPSDLLDDATIGQVTLDYNSLDVYPKFHIPNFGKMWVPCFKFNSIFCLLNYYSWLFVLLSVHNAGFLFRFKFFLFINYTCAHTQTHTLSSGACSSVPNTTCNNGPEIMLVHSNLCVFNHILCVQLSNTQHTDLPFGTFM